MEEIKELIQQQNDLLLAILEELQSGLHVKREGNDKKYAPRSPLCEDDMNELNEEIDFDAWFSAYGEEALPAHYMNFTSGIEYSKQEKDYLYRRLVEIAGMPTKPTNDQGTHEFTSVGKVWCGREKQARNCFQFKAIG